MRFLL